MGSAIESILENILDGNAEMRTPKSRVEELLMQILNSKKYLHMISIKLDSYSATSSIFLKIYSSSKTAMTASDVYSYLAALGPAANTNVNYPVSGYIDDQQEKDTSKGVVSYVTCIKNGTSISAFYFTPLGGLSMKIFTSSDGWTVTDSVIAF